MKRIIFFLCLLVSVNVFGQISQPPNTANYQRISQGYSWNRGHFGSLHLPTGCGAPSGAPATFFGSNKIWNGSGALYLDSCNQIFYMWLTGSWHSFNSTLNVDTIYRTPGVDSIYWIKNGITFALKDSTGGGSFDTTTIYDNLALKQNYTDTNTYDATRTWTTNNFWSQSGNYGINPATEYFGVNDSIQGIPIKLNNHYAGWIGNHSDLTVPTGPFFFTEGGFLGYGIHSGKNLIPRIITNDAFVRVGGAGYGAANMMFGTGSGMSLGAIFDTAYSPQNFSTENTGFGWQVFQSLQFQRIGSSGGRNSGFGVNTLRSAVAVSNSAGFGFSNMEYLSKGFNMSSFGPSGFRSAVDNRSGAGLGTGHGIWSSTGINTITVNTGGSDYHQDSIVVTVSTPLQTEAGSQCDFPATAVATVEGGVVTAITVTYPGCGYSTTRTRRYFIATDPSLGLHPLPTVTITSTRVGGLGTGATATPNVSSADYQTSIGESSMAFYLMGQNNTGLGNQSGNGLTRYADSLTTMLGAFTGADVANSTTNLVRYLNSTAVGANSKFNKSNQMVFGDANVVEIKMNADTLYVPDLDVIYGTNNSIAFSKVAVVSQDSIFKVNSRKYPSRNKLYVGHYNFANIMDETFDTTRTDGNVNRIVLLVNSLADSSHKLSKNGMVTMQRFFQMYDSMSTVFGVNTHRPYSTIENRTTWWMPRARYTLVGSISQPNANVLNNMIIGASADTVEYTVGSTLYTGLSNIWQRFDAAPNAQQFVQHKGWYNNILSTFSHNNKANSIFERFNHIAVAASQTGNNGQSVTTMVGLYIEGLKDQLFTTNNAYAIWTAGTTDSSRFDGIVRMPNLPSGKKAKQVYWENGVLYQADSTTGGGGAGTPGGSDTQFQWNNDGVFDGSNNLSQQLHQIFVQGTSTEITPLFVATHEDMVAGYIAEFQTSSGLKFGIGVTGNMTMAEVAAPGTPASGFFDIYVKSDGKIYGKNDAGTEYDLTAGGADTHIGNTNLTLSGARTLAFGGNSLAFTGTGSFSNASGVSLAFDATTGLNVTNLPSGDGENLLSVIDGGLENGKIYQVTIGTGLDLTAGVLSVTGGGGFTVTNEGDNRVITSTGTNTGNAETNLYFDGNLGAVLTNGLTSQDDAKGFLLSNNTDASDGVQQISGALRWKGEGWKTNATAASQDVNWRAWVLPIQGASNPSSQWKLQQSVNGASYTDNVVFNSGGNATFTSSTTTHYIKANLELGYGNGTNLEIGGDANYANVVLTNVNGGNNFTFGNSTWGNSISSTGSKDLYFYGGAAGADVLAILFTDKTSEFKGAMKITGQSNAIPLLTVEENGGNDVLTVIEQDGSYGSAAVTITGNAGTNQRALVIGGLGVGDAGIFVTAGNGGSMNLSNVSGGSSFGYTLTNTSLYWHVSNEGFDNPDQSFKFSHATRTNSKRTVTISGQASQTGELLRLENSSAVAQQQFFPDGTAIFAGDVTVPGETFGTGWNGSNEAAAKNDIYDWGQTLNSIRHFYVSTTAAGNVGTGEDDLMTKSIDAGLLATDGDYIEFTMTFTFAANANNKQVKVYFGGQELYASTAQAQNDGTLTVVGRVIRTGATSQIAMIETSTDAVNFADVAKYTTPAETLSGAITLKATGEATSNNDISQKALTIKYVRSN